MMVGLLLSLTPPEARAVAALRGWAVGAPPPNWPQTKTGGGTSGEVPPPWGKTGATRGPSGR
jgi:hypothetical protein